MWSARGGLQLGQLRVDPVPNFLCQRLQRPERADHDLEFDHFARLVEFDEVDAPEWPLADIGGKFQRGPVGPVYSPVLALSEAPFEQVHDEG